MRFIFSSWTVKFTQFNDYSSNLSSAYDSRNNIINELGAELRANIKKHKAADGYSTAIGSALGIIGESTDFNPNDFQPELNVEYSGGALKFRVTKKG